MPTRSSKYKGKRKATQRPQAAGTMAATTTIQPQTQTTSRNQLQAARASKSNRASQPIRSPSFRGRTRATSQPEVAAIAYARAVIQPQVMNVSNSTDPSGANPTTVSVQTSSTLLTWSDFTNQDYANYEKGFPVGTRIEDFLPLGRAGSAWKQQITTDREQCETDDDCFWDSLVAGRPSHVDIEKLVSIQLVLKVIF